MPEFNRPLSFNACDGSTEFADLKRSGNFTAELIYLALDELKRQNLRAEDYTSPFVGISRRAVIRKAGLGTFVALPVITGLIPPQATNAASRCGTSNQACTFDNYGQGNCCDGLRCETNVCFDCIGSGDDFAFVTAGGSVAACNARSR